MARFDDDDATVGAALYNELLAIAEEKFARHGGRRVLIRAGMVITANPGPGLAALRAGQPVGLNDWQLPRWVRNGKVRNRRVTVHPDGRVVDIDG